MIGKCPHCSINLKVPPFNGRELSETLITLKYRDFIESDKPLPPIEKTGYCSICRATKEDIQTQENCITKE